MESELDMVILDQNCTADREAYNRGFKAGQEAERKRLAATQARTWQKTVLTDGDLLAIRVRWLQEAKYGGQPLIKRYLERQANHSFEVGQKQGMQEVVDWVRSHKESVTNYGETDGLFIVEKAWQSFLAERGLK